MVAIHRLKRNFTAGELSPLLSARINNERFKNGCVTLLNMLVKPQGPVTRRPGLGFIYDLTSLLDGHFPDEKPRMVPFEFNEVESYALVFYRYSADEITWTTRFVVGYGDGLVADDVNPTEPFVYEIAGDFDIDTFAYSQSGDILYIAQSGRIVLEVKRVTRNSWTVTEMAIIDQPSDWNATDGFPEIVSFYEQRIVFGANQSRPQTLWFSKSGDFYDFGKATPDPLASDSIVLTLDSGTLNKIRWMSSARNLLVGTLGDEWSIFGGSYEPLSYKNPRAIRHTNNGSQSLKPLMIGQVTIFLERFGTTVNQFVFDYNSDAYDVVDLSVLAPHLTEVNTITEWGYQQTPGGVIWCVRDDGNMIALTFKREHKVTGWHRHDTQGKFMTMASVPGSVQDDVWAVIERDISGVRKWYIEKMKPEFRGDDLTEAYFCDSHISAEFEEAVSEVSGLAHLEGMKVTALADGAVVPDQVVTQGKIQLQMPAKKIVVGLHYESIVEPTMGDVPMKDGTILGRIQRVTKLDIILVNSLGFEYGTIHSEDGEFMEEEPFRKPGDLTGQSVPIFSGTKEVDFMEGYDEMTRVLVRQKQPLPLTVVGLVDTFEAYK